MDLQYYYYFYNQSVNSINKVRVYPLLLLCIYLYSTTLSVLFHHHHSVLAFTHANECEKVIFFDISEKKCEHEKHFSSTIEKCKFCDHHIVDACVMALPCFAFISTIYNQLYAVLPAQKYLRNYFIFENKGPPTV